jgi:hypothetical protein
MRLKAPLSFVRDISFKKVVNVFVVLVHSSQTVNVIEHLSLSQMVDGKARSFVTHKFFKV